MYSFSPHFIIFLLKGHHYKDILVNDPVGATEPMQGAHEPSLVFLNAAHIYLLCGYDFKSCGPTWCVNTQGVRTFVGELGVAVRVLPPTGHAPEHDVADLSVGSE